MAQRQGNKHYAHSWSPPHTQGPASHSDGSDNLSPGQTYGTSDQETLLPRRLAPQYSASFVVPVILVVFALGFFLKDPIASYQHESLRRQWAETEGKWNSDRIFMENERSRWASLRHQWAETEGKWKSDKISMDNERLRWASLRRQWEETERKWKSDEISMENERLRWAKEREEQKGKETSQRSRIAWQGLDADEQCLRYGTREYTATLANVPLGFDAIAECQKKPIIIHGKPWFPDRCEDQGICGRVTGHWTVDSDEPLCRPWWDKFADKGCKNGVRVYDAHLQYLQPGDDWKAMCSTTPTTIKGIYFSRPMSCVEWGWGAIGGVWHLPDSSCHQT